MGGFKKIIFLVFPCILFSANLRILKSFEKIKITEDSIIRETEIKIKVLNQRGVREAGTREIEFDENSEKVKLIYGRTVNEKDTINLKQYSINVFTDPEAQDYPFLSNNKIMSLSFLGVKRNSIIEYKYRKSSEFEGKYDEIFIFREEYPVKEKIIEVEFPEKFKITYKINGNVEFKKQKLKGKIKYTFSTKDLKEIKDDPRRPPDYKISPFVFLTNYKSWEEIFKEFKKEYFESKRCERGFESPIKVLRKIKLADISYDYTGFYPDSCERALRAKIGTAPERAYLMIKSIKKPELILVLSPLLNPDTLLPGNSWIEGILIKDTDKIYDPAFRFRNLNCYPFSERKGIFINKEKLYFSKIPSSQKNLLDINLNIDLEKNLLEITCRTYGYFDKLAKEVIFYWEKERRERFLREILSEFGEFEDEKIEFKNLSSFEKNLEIKISSKIKSPVTKSGKFKILEISFPLKYPFYISKINEERENPYLREEKFYISIKIDLKAGGLMVKPYKKEIKKDVGKLTKTLSYGEKRSEIKENLYLEITKTGLWNKNDIEEYNHLIENFLSKENRVFLLR